MDYLTYLKDVVVLGDSGIGVRNKSEWKKYKWIECKWIVLKRTFEFVK